MTGSILPSAIAGVILAGGLARRMGGGDKGLRLLAGRPILDHVIERARPQVAALVLNANGPAERFAGYGLPVVADGVEGFAGPLAGVLAGLDWAAANAPGCTHLASFACDAPFLPRDLVARLAAAVGRGADLACAASDGRAHPVFGLWPLSLRDDLRRALVEEGVRKVDVWTARHRLVHVDFPLGPIDPFFNANRPEDLEVAERHFRALADQGGRS
ncbi:MAG: molybdenum cofactor guanylyltransferase MobA [Inquilinus sp.]|nr:molybdenum cofactor guanylyltransferase MobA [Inquilinus sp.]